MAGRGRWVLGSVPFFKLRYMSSDIFSRNEFVNEASVLCNVIKFY